MDEKRGADGRKEEAVTLVGLGRWGLRIRLNRDDTQRYF